MAGVWPLVGRTEELGVISRVLSDPGEYRGVAVAGRAGVGKSRLAREAVAAASSLGWAPRWVVGTVTGRGIPLGAFAQWTDGLDGNPLTVVRQVISAMTADTDGSPILLAVDDAHLLDDLSAFVLYQLVLQRVALVVATIRSGELVPDAVSALWKDRYLQRLELQALSRLETEELLVAALRAPVCAVVPQRMWELSRGNALFVRQLVDQELAADRLRLDGECWRWSGPVQVTDSLVDLVETQIGAVPDAVADVVDVVAVGEPLDRAALAALVDAAAIEEAERRGLIAISGAGRIDTVRVGHPLYAEVRLAQCGVTRLRRLRGSIAAALASSGTGSLADPVRTGLLWLDSDLPPDPEVYLLAAQAAFLRVDLGHAEQLAAAAVVAGAGVEARLLHAHALVLLNQGEAAAHMLDSFNADELTERAWSQVLQSRAGNLMWPLANPAKSWTVIDEALSGASGSLVADLQAFRAMQMAFAGRPAEVPVLVAGVDFDLLTPHSALMAAWAQVIAFGDLGSPAQAGSAAAAGYLRAGASPEAAYQGVRMAEFHVSALLLAGEIDQAVAAADHTRLLCADVPGMPGSVATAVAGMAYLGSGDLTAAWQCLSGALDDFAAYGERPGVFYRFAIVATEVLARMGRIPEATAMAEQMKVAKHPAYVRVESDRLLAQAWVAAATGRTAQARGLAARAAEFARDHSQWAREVTCLQAEVGFGDARVGDRLDELADLVDGPRAGLAARFAHAMARGDGVGLATVSVDFESVGDRLTAADAAGHSAAAFGAVGRRGSALSARTRARRLAAECAAVLHPGLQTAGVDFRLTRREREIVTLVAQGMTNKAIAEEMSMSIRTVEGHIYRVCTRLNLNSRTELASLMADHAAAGEAAG